LGGAWVCVSHRVWPVTCAPIDLGFGHTLAPDVMIKGSD